MKIGTRGSALALWQAHTVARLVAELGGPACEIVVIRTSGDERSAGAPPDLPAAGPVNVKRTFVKEIEEALANGAIDVAVHSGKDLPALLPDGLAIGAVLARADARDAIVLPAGRTVRSLGEARQHLGSTPRIGTSSVRRTAQLRGLFPTAAVVPMRGNVDTRLRKLDTGECDAILLAAAGLIRLGLEARVSAALPVELFVPAPCQGIVAVEVREGDQATRRIVSAITDADASTAFIAERAVVMALGAHCQMPLGAYAELDGQSLTLRAVVASLDGRRVIRAEVRGHRGGAAAAGDKLAAHLLAKGAADILS